MMKRVFCTIMGILVMCSMVWSEGTELESLSSDQISAMIMLAVNTNIHFFSDDSVGDNISEASADPENQVKLGLIQTMAGREITITRIGKLNAEGKLPVEFSFKYPGKYLSNGKVKQGYILYEKQVVRISKEVDDFGDTSFILDASSVIKSESERVIRDTVSLSEVRLNNLVQYIPQMSKKPAESGYDKIKVGTVFSGTYYKGTNDLKFTITEFTPIDNGWSVKANVEFLYQHKKAGSYTVAGTLDASTEKMRLEKVKAIKMPSGFSMMSWTGTLSQDTLEWKGFALEQITVEFEVKAQ